MFLGVRLRSTREGFIRVLEHFIHFSFLCIFLYDCINDLFYDLYDCSLKILGRTFVRCYTFTKDTYTL